MTEPKKARELLALALESGWDAELEVNAIESPPPAVCGTWSLTAARPLGEGLSVTLAVSWGRLRRNGRWVLLRHRNGHAGAVFVVGGSGSRGRLSELLGWPVASWTLDSAAFAGRILRSPERVERWLAEDEAAKGRPS